MTDVINLNCIKYLQRRKFHNFKKNSHTFYVSVLYVTFIIEQKKRLYVIKTKNNKVVNI